MVAAENAFYNASPVPGGIQAQERLASQVVQTAATILRQGVMSDIIPPHVQQLISDHIRSIAQLELLLLLQGDRERTWTVDAAARDLYIAATMTEPLLESLVAIGLVAATEGAPKRFQYWPKTPELDQTVRELAALYQQRRVTITNLIYSGPIQKLQNFADAFRIRKKEED